MTIGSTKRIASLQAELWSLKFPNCKFIVFKQQNQEPGYYAQACPEKWEKKKFLEHWEKRTILQVWLNGDLVSE